MDAILLEMYIQKRTNDLENPANQLTKMHYISKNWECIFYFQYKVAIGQYDLGFTHKAGTS